MLTPKTSQHIRTHRNIKNCHACRTTTGFALHHIDRWRVQREEMALATKLARFAWLNRLRARHLEQSRWH